uniref:Uncharacterized protein n=1 Tax=Thermococcus sp. EXT9 TaxID=1197732 RepID=L0BAS0_9EURY|nr:hypothetical protein [Thermococcus sp. EXT9]AFZ84274.1 hypothetical protein e9a-2 [Thermococcus sp. EXT9]
MKIRKYLVALASWKRSNNLIEDTGDPFYLVFALGPRGGLRYIMAVPIEKINNLGDKAVGEDYRINPKYEGFVYGVFLTPGIIRREVKFRYVAREDLLEKLIPSGTKAEQSNY